MPGTRKLGRPTAHRNAMLRGMVTYLIENGSIETTLTRAKEVRAIAEKMITLGKKNTLASRRAALAYITKEDVVKKLFDEVAPKYGSRNGGYTQIFKLGPRRGDAAEGRGFPPDPRSLLCGSRRFRRRSGEPGDDPGLLQRRWDHIHEDPGDPAEKRYCL